MTRRAESPAAATDGMGASTGVTGIPGDDSSELDDGDRAPYCSGDEGDTGLDGPACERISCGRTMGEDASRVDTREDNHAW